MRLLITNYKKFSIVFALALSLAVATFGFLAWTASAHSDPAGCSLTGPTLLLGVFQSDGTTPIVSASPGDTIYYKAILSHIGPPQCNYGGGTLGITKPNGLVADVTGTLGATTISFGAPFISSLVSYVVNSADVGGDADLDASATYAGGTSHFGESNVTPVGATTPINTPFVKLTPTIDTTPNPESGAVGVELNDTATLSGGFSPTGNVTFKLFPPSDATCQGTAVFSQADGAAPYTTGPGYTSLVAGIYRWTADYAGDDNNNPVSSGCQDEQVTLTQILLLEVEKTSRTAHQKSWDWDIVKSADQTNLLLAEGESLTVNYTVNVSAVLTETIDESGTIAITNPLGNPSATITGVTDTLSIDGAATVTCTPNTFPQVLAAGATLNCTYQKSPGAAVNQDNTATVTTSGDVPGGSDTVPVTFDPATLIDECIVVDDTNPQGPQDVVVCQDTVDKTLEYSITFGPAGGQGVDVVVECGEIDHPNTASYVTQDDSNDTGENDSDDHNVHVTVECNVGCTLTQGYWKTHNDSFKGGAPTDDNWDNVTTLAELTGFFTNAAPSYPVAGLNVPPFTWFTVFWTAPKGNVYYNLAHQYMAAKLNILNGASTTPAVDAAILAAEDLFDSTTPATAAGLKGGAKAPWTSLAGTLDSYNEGTIGPGHCDEEVPNGV